jgi:multicomponent Na+:H+ antiporter subunit D
MVSSLLNLVYLGEIVLRGFFAKPTHGLKSDDAQEAPLSMLLPLCLTAAMSLALFFAIDMFILDFGG